MSSPSEPKNIVCTICGEETPREKIEIDGVLITDYTCGHCYDDDAPSKDENISWNGDF